MRRIASGLIVLLLAGGFMLTGGGPSAKPAEAGVLQDIIQLVFSDPPSHNSTAGASCTAPSADSGVYTPSGYKFSKTMTYKVNQKTFPSYLSKTDVQAAIDAAFSTWDNATGFALFANGDKKGLTLFYGP